MENLVTPTLDQVLAQVVQQLATFFGTTTTAVMDGMPQFLTMYAWYSTLNNMWYVPVIICTGLFISLFVWFVFDSIDEDACKNYIKTGFYISISICIFLIIKNIILCLICPEIVGGMNLLETIGYLTN